MSLCVHMFLLPFLVELFVVLDSFSTVVVVLVWKKKSKELCVIFSGVRFNQQTMSQTSSLYSRSVDDLWVVRALLSIRWKNCFCCGCGCCCYEMCRTVSADHVRFDVVGECAHALPRNEHFGERECVLSTASSTVLDGYILYQQTYTLVAQTPSGERKGKRRV